MNVHEALMMLAANKLAICFDIYPDANMVNALDMAIEALKKTAARKAC